MSDDESTPADEPSSTELVVRRAPRPVTPKDKALSLKQRRWLAHYIETGNASEAAARVYTCKNRHSAQSIGWENLRVLRLHITAIMEEMGLTLPLLMRTMKDGLEATVVSRAEYMGKFGDTVKDIDYETRFRYLTIALKLRDIAAPSKLEISGADGAPLQLILRRGPDALPAEVPDGEKDIED